MKKSVFVVAAVIENDRSEILCALRSKNMALPCLWEFPGGKVKPQESEREALRREIEEELQCQIEVYERFEEVQHEYDSFIIRMVSYLCRLQNGLPTPTEHAQIAWLEREYLGSLVWAPADLPIVRKLMNTAPSPSVSTT